MNLEEWADDSIKEFLNGKKHKEFLSHEEHVELLKHLLQKKQEMEVLFNIQKTYKEIMLLAEATKKLKKENNFG